MINYRHIHQRGGTVVGIIIGLIIGLAIAVVVALAITKTSLPFLNKVGKQDRPAELTPGQAADPNKPLYGNNSAAKEAAKEFAPQPTTPELGPDGKPVTPAGVPAVPPAPANTVAPAAAPAATSAKAGTDAKADAAKAAAPVAKPDNPDDKWVYYLQAGAFRDQADADNSKAKLALAGFEASVSDRQSDTGSLYRVRIGPFNQLEAMNRVRGKLSDSGIDVAVVRIAK